MSTGNMSGGAPDAGAARTGDDEVGFLRRVLITLGVVLVTLIAWQIRDALLLMFGGIVVAVGLLALARPLERLSGLSRTWSLAAVGLGLIALLALVGFLVGAEVLAQVRDLAEELPDAVGEASDRLGLDIPIPGRDGGGAAGQGLDGSMLGSIVGYAASIGTGVANALTAVVVAVIGGYFLAADPRLYRRGAAKLLPRSQRERAEEAMAASGEALRLWLGAQLISMALTGVLAGVGTWVIGLPSPVALALFAGLAGFVPLIGAVAGAVPALMLALAEGGATLLWTAGLFLVIQQLESNMIAPVVQRRLVSLPPALVLFAVVAVGLLFGLPGVILAAPITVVVFVLVKKLYVRETLGHATEVPGEDKTADDKKGE
ncbi:AI-2E family transporter [Elioraea rosea]|uniref:AI-2E family transporter n=1 Tax=Elioraea rosea TaxID=2492390 RepID=UPI0013155419|nr:AI-2E family transporter [Elioraea rosea]